MEKIRNIFSHKFSFLFSLLIFLAFLFSILPAQSKKAALYTPESGSFDSSFYYSPGDVHNMITAYGDQGRRSYIRARWTFDLVFPMAYGFFLLSSLAFSTARFKTPFFHSSRWLLLPLIAVFFDLLENSLVTILMIQFPSQNQVLSFGASLATLFKWGFVSLSMVLAFLFPLGWALVSVLKRFQGE